MPLAQRFTEEELALLPHEDRGGDLLGVHWGLTAAATVFLLLRLYCKFFIKRNLWWDDWILIASWFTILATDTLTTILVRQFGLGRHSYDQNIYDPPLFIVLINSRATTTLTSLAWTKTGFAVALLRLTTDRTKAFVWFIIISINVTLGFSAAVPFIQCQPLAKAWHGELPGNCWPPGVGTKLWIGTGAYSALVDFVLAALPWTFLYRLMLKRKEKIGILLAMSMGVVAGAVAIVKCVQLPRLGQGDAFYEVDLFAWDIAESTVTMMAACIPALRVLLRDVKQSSVSGGRSIALSQFSMSFMSTRMARNLNGDIEVVQEGTMLSKEDTTQSSHGRTRRSAGGEGAGERYSSADYGRGARHHYIPMD
ncbi:hypothetical protein B0I37DRAFT_387145 [Chaetomium sp. MPI-CAGE-AT-0009]|nr:hypothetical protein B0I37DRAFT_387145 [Chaetomium sp. MPI-CAGE-AT-0009]